jgi:hypothetical protein
VLRAEALKEVAMRKGLLAVVIGAILSSGRMEAAGNLKFRGSHGADIQIRDHHVAVVINNGFASTEVTQTFFNPNEQDLEAVYTFPLPRSASLSEFEVFLGETSIQGEVLERGEATRCRQRSRPISVSPRGGRHGRRGSRLLDPESEGGREVLREPGAEIGLADRGCARPRLRA